ncbi:hypothetical protein [Acinetobacter soli]|uniref:hypothetical protein n=1 Tax=Acinetobacter soli TaxID=487316 RepID=UPI001486AC86
MERFNRILKQEFLTTRCKTMKGLNHLIADSIVTCNYYRPHLSFSMFNPNRMYERKKPS